MVDNKTFKKIVKESRGISNALSKMNLIPSGGNYKIFHRRVKDLGISIDHFKGQAWSRGDKLGPYHNRRYPSDKMFTHPTQYRGTTNRVKARLIEEGHKEWKCYSCNKEKWLDDKIPLELEHINGDNTDNRIDNLTLLCPNCHALTKTYRGKNKKKIK